MHEILTKGASWTAQGRILCQALEQDEKLPDLASSLRRLVSRVYREAVPNLQDSLAQDQFIDAL